MSKAARRRTILAMSPSPPDSLPTDTLDQATKGLCEMLFEAHLAL
jgi:hypothetical protein